MRIRIGTHRRWMIPLAAVLAVTTAAASAETGRVVRLDPSGPPQDVTLRLQEHLQSGDAAGPLTIELAAGTYILDAPLKLTRSNLTIRPAEGAKVRIVGGREVVRWHRVWDYTMRERMQPGVRERVRQLDLKAEGITDFGTLHARGFGRPLHPAGLELFFHERPMTVARWPNDGWAAITSVPDGPQGGRFTCERAPMHRWTEAKGLMVHGFWTWEWAESYEHVTAIDPATHTFVTAPPHGVYGYSPGRRFYVCNLIEELDAPSEYYLDREKGMLYFITPEVLERQETWVSILEEPLITIDGASDVTIEGITFEYTRGPGIVITGGERNRLQKCRIRNIGTVGVRIAGGRENGLIGCEIRDTGDGGVILDGGDRATLTPGGNFVENCHIYRYQRTGLTYRPAVRLVGVGQRVANNLIHDGAHSAIILNGNDHVIEYNEIHTVCTMSGDAGAFYLGRDLTERGNIVRYNYFHNLQPVAGRHGFHDVMGVYLDDCASGTTVIGNVFRNVSRAVMVGGGRDNTIENNVFLGCTVNIHVDARATTWAKKWWNGQDNTLVDRLKAVRHDQPPYSERYPRLGNVLNERPEWPAGNRIAHNIIVGKRLLTLLDKVQESDLELEDNLVTAESPFVDAAAGNFELKPDAQGSISGYKPIPFSQIGPDHRPAMPVPQHTPTQEQNFQPDPD